jgi:predicted TIM-barrel fold metal-dependent hydrolase
VSGGVPSPMREQKLIIDAHAHLGPAFQTRPPMLPGVTGEQIVRILDDAEIDKACVFAPAWEGAEFVDPGYEKANRAIYFAVREHPDRLIGYCRIDPNQIQQAEKEMVRCHDEYGFKGLKLHPLWEHFLPSNTKIIRPILRRCQEYGWPIFWHAGYYPTCEPALFFGIAGEYPRVNHILAHLAYAHTLDAIILSQEYANVFLETSGNSTAQAIGATATAVGPEKLIFGSDLPFTQPEDVIMKIKLQPRLSAQDLDLVMGGNMARLLDLPHVGKGKQ